MTSEGVKPRYKNKGLQQKYEAALKLTYPISFEKDGIGGTAKSAWNSGYEGIKRSRSAKGSTAWTFYYAGKEKSKLDRTQKK